MTTNDFIEKAKKVHGDKYDYSKVIYNTTNEKVCIICPEHGEFWQTPHTHLKGCGCKKCANGKIAKNNSFTNEEFIEKAKKVHGDKYDYSKVEYVNSHTKVCIIDPEYGEFWQTPISHLKGYGHPAEWHKKTWDVRGRMTTEKFIEKAKKVHGNKYDYSKVKYVNSRSKICVICPIHGEFNILPYNFLNRNGCKQCGLEKSSKKQSLGTENFIKKAEKIHGHKYDYSKTNYINNHTKVCIIDPEYGEFWQLPTTHLKGCGHPLEGHEKTLRAIKLTTEKFIEKAKKVHGDKYDYSKVNYIDGQTKVCIICPKHGEFWQTPENHLQKKGCKQCGNEKSIEKQTSNTKEFIEKAKIIHGNKYNYQKVEYSKAREKVLITCPKHGDFWQTAYNHLSGNGCPLCNSSRLENDIKKLLDSNGIKYAHRDRSIKCLNGLELDFYLPDYGIAIECQGLQHFEPVDIFGGEENFKHRVENDTKKRKLCEENGIKLLYYSDLGIEYPYKVFEDKKKILNEIFHE